MSLSGGAPAPTIAEALARPANGFAATRLALALAVVVSHAFSVTTGRPADEPLMAWTGFSLGEHAVNAFFAISGFLVTMSYLRRGWRDYAVSRALRIVPGLVVAALAVSLLLGAALTRLDLGAYLADPSLWRYVTGLLTTFKTNAALPGVFPENPFRYPMGTVWTLKYEVFCYLGVLVSGLAGTLSSRRLGAAFTAALVLGMIALDLVLPNAGKGQETAIRLPLLFVAGGTLYLFRHTVRLSAWPLVALAAAAAASHGTPGYKALLFIAEAYGVIWVAFSQALSRPRLDLRHDLSYGVYLYGWPIQQALVQIVPGASAWALMGPALALTLAVAALSWFGVERPALALKARTLGRRTIRTTRPAAP